MTVILEVQTPTHILGQRQAIQFLQSAVQKQRVTTAYCFVGPAGVGRALTARWFGQVLLCEQQHRSAGQPQPLPCGRCLDCRLIQQGNHPDLLWVEPTFLYQGKLLTAPEAIAQQLNRRSPPQIRLEQVHTISSFAARSPLRGQRSLIVVDGAETLAESAANALLKTLEEPGNALLIVITPSLSDLLPTLVSRCHVIPFQRLAAEDLTRVLQQHGALALPPELISLAQGSPGSALRCWEQWQLIPMDLLLQCQTWPAQLPQALTLGRTIARTLDVPAQLWLIDYLQHYFWQQRQSAYIRQLETLRKQLLSFVQPQLAWEIHLSAFC